MRTRITVLEIRQLLDTLPDDLPVEFLPISDAWLGTNNPMRVNDFRFYKNGNLALPTEAEATATIYLVEDDD